MERGEIVFDASSLLEMIRTVTRHSDRHIRRPPTSTSTLPALQPQQADSSARSTSVPTAESDSAHVSVDGPEAASPVRKAARVEPAESTSPSSSSSSPRRPSSFDAHILLPYEDATNSKSCHKSHSSKHWQTMRYVDMPLSDFGAVQFLSTMPEEQASDRIAIKKWFMGKNVCHLKLGTSLVFTGIVSDVNKDHLLFVPDKDQPSQVEWIEMRRAYCVPDGGMEALTTLRAAVHEKVIAMLSEPYVGFYDGRAACVLFPFQFLL